MLRAAVALGDAQVVFQCFVRSLERVVELVALEEIVVAPRLVTGTVLRIDRTTDGPERTLLALDPDRHGLLGASVVHTVNDSFGKAALRRLPPHEARIQSPR